jgi:hypothetical protein
MNFNSCNVNININNSGSGAIYIHIQLFHPSRFIAPILMRGGQIWSGWCSAISQTSRISNTMQIAERGRELAEELSALSATSRVKYSQLRVQYIQ